MGANPNVQVRPSLRKVPSSEIVKPSRLDQFGRDPELISERLRPLMGYARFQFSYLADLPRLLSGGVSWAFVLTVHILAHKQPAKDGKQEWSGPVTVDELCEYCHAAAASGSDMRQVQRVLADLTERGVIECKALGRGRYNLRLAVERWRELDDYAVWKRKQAVPISKGVEPDEPADDEALEVSREALHLTKRPQTARPGRALRAMKITVGVNAITCVNKSESVNATYEVVVQPGGMIQVETNYSAAVAIEAVPDPKPAASPAKTPTLHARAPEVAALFDPIMQAQGRLLLSFDHAALNAASLEMGTMPADVLKDFLHLPRGKDSHSSRAARPISNGKACVSIVKECRLNWGARGAGVDSMAERDGLLKELGYTASWSALFGKLGPDADFKRSLSLASTEPDLTTAQQNAARRLLEILK